METTEKVIAKYFEADHEATFKHLGRLNKLIGDFMQDYGVFKNETGMPELNQSLLKEVIESGKQPIEREIEKFAVSQPKPVQKLYRETGHKELVKLEKSIRAFEGWKNGMNSITRFPSDLRDVRNLPWNGFRLALDEAYFEDIKSYFEMVFNSEVDLGLWERYKALRDAYNELQLFAKDKEALIPNNFNQLFGVHPAFPQTEVKLYPEAFLPSRSIHWRP